MSEDAFSEIEKTTFLTREEYDDLRDILATRRAVVLMGPEGSGKDFLCHKLVEVDGGVYDTATDDDILPASFICTTNRKFYSSNAVMAVMRAMIDPDHIHYIIADSEEPWAGDLITTVTELFGLAGQHLHMEFEKATEPTDPNYGETSLGLVDLTVPDNFRLICIAKQDDAVYRNICVFPMPSAYRDPERMSVVASMPKEIADEVCKAMKGTNIGQDIFMSPPANGDWKAWLRVTLKYAVREVTDESAFDSPLGGLDGADPLML